MLPLAPLLLSMTTGWARCCDRPSATKRAKISGPVPGEYGTMIVIGRVDCACAAARAQKHPTSVVPSAAPKAPTIRPDFSRCRTASLRQRLLEPDGIRGEAESDRRDRRSN